MAGRRQGFARFQDSPPRTPVHRGRLSQRGLEDKRRRNNAKNNSDCGAHGYVTAPPRRSPWNGFTDVPSPRTKSTISTANLDRMATNRDPSPVGKKRMSNADRRARRRQRTSQARVQRLLYSSRPRESKISRPLAAQAQWSWSLLVLVLSPKHRPKVQRVLEMRFRRHARNPRDPIVSNVNPYSVQLLATGTPSLRHIDPIPSQRGRRRYGTETCDLRPHARQRDGASTITSAAHPRALGYDAGAGSKFRRIETNPAASSFCDDAPSKKSRNPVSPFKNSLYHGIMNRIVILRTSCASARPRGQNTSANQSTLTSVSSKSIWSAPIIVSSSAGDVV